MKLALLLALWSTCQAADVLVTPNAEHIFRIPLPSVSPSDRYLVSFESDRTRQYAISCLEFTSHLNHLCTCSFEPAENAGLLPREREPKLHCLMRNTYDPSGHAQMVSDSHCRAYIDPDHMSDYSNAIRLQNEFTRPGIPPVCYTLPNEMPALEPVIHPLLHPALALHYPPTNHELSDGEVPIVPHVSPVSGDGYIGDSDTSYNSIPHSASESPQSLD